MTARWLLLAMSVAGAEALADEPQAEAEQEAGEPAEAAEQPPAEAEQEGGDPTEAAGSPAEPDTDMHDALEELEAIEGLTVDAMWDHLQSLPPRFSVDFAATLGVGDVGYWFPEVPPWMGLGFRGAVGWHVDNSRLGLGLNAGLEGPVPEYFSLGLEPGLQWDMIRGQVLLGATLGGVVSWNGHNSHRGFENAWSGAPSASVRLGWSQPWTRAAPRTFMGLEPRVRWINGRASGFISVFAGSSVGY